MKKIFNTTLLLLLSLSLFCQVTGTIRGHIIDYQTETPIPGVNVILSDIDSVIGTTSDINGNFKLESIPVGRVSLEFSALGYKPVRLNSLVLKSSKELIVNIKLEEKLVILDEVIIRANESKSSTINKMATVSSRAFTIEETEKYAGSLGDPSRMAQNFAGVFTAGDNRNDIIIRGNSPSGLLWRLNGVNIPNPNHFGALGSTGGPVSMLNNNLLANSDFFTSAWPAEYGNALSGVFDLNMRNGNNQNREYVFQVGFNGFELGAEGPFSKNHQSSYLLNYRYSTLSVMDKLGFKVAGGAVPEYQDLSFKVNIPTQKAGKFEIMGIMGRSSIFFDHENENEGQYSNYSSTDTENGSDMMTISLGHTYFFSENSRLESFLNLSGFAVHTNVHYYEYINAVDSINSSTGDTVFKRILDNDYLAFHENNKQMNYSAGTKFKTKINSRNYFDYGVSCQVFSINYLDSAYVGNSFGWSDNSYIRQTDISKNGIPLLESYAQWKHKFNDELFIVSGIHHQQLFSNNSWAVEPRFNLMWNFTRNQSLSLGYGLHSQMQALFLYYSQTPVENSNGIYIQNNQEMGFSKSHHSVIAYNWLPSQNFRVRIEAYYQYLFDIPVEMRASPISVINYGASFHQMRLDSLVNEGIGYNTGAEITIEKFFNNNYYFLITASIFESKYKTKDNVWRNTVFNNNYVLNVLGGYEFSINNKSLLSIDIRTVFAGGTRYIPLVLNANDEVQYDYENAYNKRTSPYFRTDLRISYKVNAKKISQEWGIDFQNLTNHKNVFGINYNSETKEIYETYQTGFYPMFLYRLNF